MNKETLELNCIQIKMDLIDIYTICAPRDTECILFSETNETFLKIHHVLDYRENLKIKK